MKEKITLKDFIPPIFFKINYFTKENILALTIFAAFVLGVLSTSVFPAKVQEFAYAWSNYQIAKNQQFLAQNNAKVNTKQSVLGVKQERSVASDGVSQGTVVVNRETDGEWVSFTTEKTNANTLNTKGTEKDANTSEVLGVKEVRVVEKQPVDFKKHKEDKGNIKVQQEADGQWVSFSVEEESTQKSVLGAKDRRTAEPSTHSNSTESVEGYYSYPSPDFYR